MRSEVVPTRGRAPTVLKTWPAAPKTFTAQERRAWQQLGDALLPLGTVSGADLIMAQLTARTMARIEEAAAANTKITAVTALIRVLSELLRSLGLTPASRMWPGRSREARSTGGGGSGAAPKNGHDPLEEFTG